MSAETQSKNDDKPLLTRVDKKLHKRVRVQAAMEDKSISQYLEELVDENTPEL